jgi:hypothetical protein
MVAHFVIPATVEAEKYKIAVQDQVGQMLARPHVNKQAKNGGVHCVAELWFQASWNKKGEIFSEKIMKAK